MQNSAVQNSAVQNSAVENTDAILASAASANERPEVRISRDAFLTRPIHYTASANHRPDPRISDGATPYFCYSH